MRRKGPLVFTFVAVFLASAAAWGSHQWLDIKAKEAASRRMATASVVVAAQDLAAGVRLEASNLQVQQWPRKNLPVGHFSKPKRLVKRVLRRAVVKGEVLLSSKLAREGSAGGLSALLPAGLRAMTVRVDEVIGVAGFLQAGDRVDVLVTVAKGAFREDPISSVVLQNVLVLAVGAQVQEQTEGKKPRRKKVTVVTLQLTPDQGERLALSATQGKVLLALRNQTDQTGPDTSGVRLTALLPAAQQEAAPQPTAASPPPPPPPPARPQAERTVVEVIKGVTKSLQQL